MFVKIGRLPGKISEVELDEGSSVSFALYTANLDPSGYEVRANGAPCDPSATLEDGDTVLLVKKIKGNAITIRIGRLPGRIQEISLDDGKTVGDALRVAGLDVSGYEVRANGAPCDPSTKLESGDTVLLVKRVKGNQNQEIFSVSLNGVEYVFDVPMDVHATIRFAGVKLGLDDHVEVNGRAVDSNHPVANGDHIQVVRRQGEEKFVTINGVSIPLLATTEAKVVLENAGFAIDNIQRITINSRWRKLCAPVNPGDEVTVVFKDEVVGICPRPIPEPRPATLTLPSVAETQPQPEAEEEAETVTETAEMEQLTIAINGLAVGGTPADLRGLILGSLAEEPIVVTINGLNVGGQAKDIREILSF